MVAGNQYRWEELLKNFWNIKAKEARRNQANTFFSLSMTQLLIAITFY
jgi:hypothetical protein